MEEEGHLEGFTNFYNRLKKAAESLFGKLETCRTGTERLNWAEKLIALGTVYGSVGGLKTSDLTEEEIQAYYREHFDPNVPLLQTTLETFQQILDCYLGFYRSHSDMPIRNLG
jgi:hypothetical protein